MKKMWLVHSEVQHVVRTLTWMASKPQYSLASSSKGTSACSKRVVPHVFKMKRLLETNMLLSLWRIRTSTSETSLLNQRRVWATCGLLMMQLPSEQDALYHTRLCLTEAQRMPKERMPKKNKECHQAQMFWVWLSLLIVVVWSLLVLPVPSIPLPSAFFPDKCGVSFNRKFLSIKKGASLCSHLELSPGCGFCFLSWNNAFHINWIDLFASFSAYFLKSFLFHPTLNTNSSACSVWIGDASPPSLDPSPTGTTQ